MIIEVKSMPLPHVPLLDLTWRIEASSRDYIGDATSGAIPTFVGIVFEAFQVHCLHVPKAPTIGWISRAGFSPLVTPLKIFPLRIMEMPEDFPLRMAIPKFTDGATAAP